MNTELPVQSSTATHLDSLQTASHLILSAIDEDPSREGLLRTPERFSRAWRDLTQGYAQSARSVVGKGVFSAESAGLVSVREIEFYSLCEHHLLPFWGKASVAYYPTQKILGLSKLPRIVDVFAKRLQVQERLTQEIVDAIDDLIHPRAIGVRIEACHLCMMMRGVQKQHALTVTEAQIGLENLTPTEADRLWKSLE